MTVKPVDDEDLEVTYHNGRLDSTRKPLRYCDGLDYRRELLLLRGAFIKLMHDPFSATTEGPIRRLYG